MLEPALDVPIAIEEEVVMTSNDAITDEAEEKENSYPTHENHPVHSPADKGMFTAYVHSYSIPVFCFCHTHKEI